ncbi:MAG: C-GCAxxG-C-C family (seleno)protein [Planctomycetia bacterium]|nr:C-GCAxxG-C-C family (seleno)protein [Planctomycetia bacterium]
MERRDILKNSLLTIGTLFSGSLASSSASGESSPKAESSQSPANPWEYQILDPIRTAEKAYHLYPDGSCMYASFRAIVESVGEKTGEIDLQKAQKFLSFPFGMMKYGKGGIYDYGTLCGAANGCAAAVALFVSDTKMAKKIVDELFRFYETESLPKYVPAENSFHNLEKSVAGSVLCHLSLTQWRAESGAEISSPRRKERCRRLTADITGFAVSLLNRWQKSSDANPCSFAEVSDSTKNCTKCHSPKGDQKDASTRMNCDSCHEDIDEKHPNK